ncbi:Stf0 family sulfotransferase [Tabrizicola sp.]|uniref:Stf0 family sulfotransferase n=1 Tax=Tabrizicola sp. TaxID=2005166 RepID=UPI001A3DF503|nr:Stf0 family sulfotransferase [Tabrizicola sp.]MBL9074278.1 sulfotransferase [Tabrizicola sp.]
MGASYDSYIICGTPRTGSTLLCDLLASTRFAGEPDSFFMHDVDPIWAERWGLPPREGKGTADHSSAYLKATIAAGRGQTKIFGLRLMWESLPDLMAMLDQVHPAMPSDKARLQAAFGRVLYVHLSRHDKLAQAISMVKAEQTGLWHIAPDGSELERLGPSKEPEYDFVRIKAKLDELASYDAKWVSWFSEQKIEPLRITYETLSERPDAAILAICEELGVPKPSPGALAPGVAKLADAVSREWIARFRADAAGRGVVQGL